MSGRIVFHIDVNSAFLSWSALDRINRGIDQVDLRTIPSAVGGDEQARHGVVLAKSTPAKRYGVATGEALMTARKKCPNLVVVQPDFHLYVEQSAKLRRILEKYCDQVIPYSIDEAWMIFEGFEALHKDPEAFANKLREEVRDTLGFTVNIGISENMLLAKMAGDFKKPDMVHTLFRSEIPKKLWPLPVGKLMFAGKAAVDKIALKDIDMETALGDIEKLMPQIRRLGGTALRAKELLAARKAEISAIWLPQILPCFYPI